MILEILLCATAAKADCEHRALKLPETATYQECQDIRTQLLSTREVSGLPEHLYAEITCK